MSDAATLDQVDQQQAPTDPPFACVVPDCNHRAGWSALIHHVSGHCRRPVWVTLCRCCLGDLETTLRNLKHQTRGARLLCAMCEAGIVVEQMLRRVRPL